MKAKPHVSDKVKRQPRYHFGSNVPMRLIRRYARRIAERFRPEKIILFGSHAYGAPHADSDVDLLVIMPARNELDQSFKIRLALPAPFPMDLIVRTPKNLKWRLADGESFHSEIMTRGKVLYEREQLASGCAKPKTITRSPKCSREVRNLILTRSVSPASNPRRSTSRPSWRNLASECSGPMTWSNC